MKSLNSIRNYGLALLAMVIMIASANAQSRYKHVPRVKVDKKTEKITLPQEKAVATPTTSAYLAVEETNTTAAEPVVNAENTTVASSTDEVVTINHKTKSVIKHDKVEKNNKKTDRSSFTKKVKENSKLLDVKDVKKANLQKWLLYMIICLIVAVVFTILAVALAVALIYGGAYALIYVFWAIAALAWLGAIIFLILGLAGVMS